MRNPTCSLCDFSKTTQTVCLCPENAEPHEVLVLADSPTKNDDANATVFYSGVLKLVIRFLREQNIDPYYTYAVKCPKPNKEAKINVKLLKTCHYLQDELALVKPKHIIALGKTAFQAVKAKGIDEKVGNRSWNPDLNAWIYYTVHHFQATYDEDQRKTLQRHLLQFVEWMAKSDSGESIEFAPPIRVIKTLAGLKQLRKDIAEAGGVVAVDTETTGLDPFDPKGRVRCIQFCWDAEKGGVFVPLAIGIGCYCNGPEDIRTFWKTEPLEEAVAILRDILLESKCIWHNGKFDRLWLKQWGRRKFGAPIEAPNIYMDTLHVAHLLNENRPLKLKMLLTEELGFPSYDIKDKQTKDLSILIPYATNDTVATFLLAKKYAKALIKNGNEKLRQLYIHVIRKVDTLYTEAEELGWPIDYKRIHAKRVEVEEQLDGLRQELIALLKSEGVKATKTTFGSPKQLTEIIFGTLRYPPNPDKRIAKTKTGGLSTGSKALYHLKEKPFIKLLLEWRGVAKAFSTYLVPMEEAAQTRGRLSTSYKIHGTVTGRTASGKEDTEEGGGEKAEGMNLQNIPYTFDIRNAIKTKPGWVILEADLSQIELRIAGHLSQDPLLIKTYKTGGDLHTLRAMRVLGVTPEEWAKLPKEKQKEARKRAKPVNFGFLYGMGANNFVNYALNTYGITFTLDESTSFRQGFFTDHVGLLEWYKQQEAEVKKFGYVTTLTGRRRHLPNAQLDPDKDSETKRIHDIAMRQAINSPVQSFGSGDLKFMAMIDIAEGLDPKKARLLGDVHDSVVLEVRDDPETIKEIANLCLKVMEHPTALDKLGIELSVPIGAEVKVGPSLGECEDYHV